MRKLIPLRLFVIVVGLTAGSLPFGTGYGHSPLRSQPAIKVLLPTSNLDTLRNFDVQSYNLLLDWRRPFHDSTSRFSGKNEIVLAIVKPSDSIQLDAGLMTIDTLWINGILVTNPPQPDANSHLTLSIPAAFRTTGSIVSLNIAYTRTATRNIGMYYFPKGRNDNSNDSIRTEEDLCYTMSEPNDARFWMPCLDAPDDKADSKISIIVPRGIVATSNGVLNRIDTNSDGSLTYEWQSDRPIVTYLMAATASKFVQWHDAYHRLSNPLDSVPTLYYAWPTDYGQDSITDGRHFNARYSFRRTPEMIATMSRLVGEYPFKQYGQVPVYPFYFGGQEHQTMTTVNRRWLNGQAEFGFFHELSHHWFGDKTTCETWNDVWLNEGFATFCEGLWAEHVGGTPFLRQHQQEKAAAYFGYGDHTLPIYGNDINRAFTDGHISTLIYEKASCVIYQLRRLVNDDTMFFGALRDYSNAFAYSTINTVQFRDYMSARLHRDLTEYFAQWVYGPGSPVYAIEWAQPAPASAGIRVIQTQDPATEQDHFTMPLNFWIYYHSGAVDTLQFLDDARTKRFPFAAFGPIDSIGFDQDRIILSRFQIIRRDSLSIAPTVNALVSGEMHAVYSKNQVIIEFGEKPASGAHLTLTDVSGRAIFWADVHDSRLAIPTNSYPSGAYFVNYSNNGSSHTLRISLVH